MIEKTPPKPKIFEPQQKHTKLSAKELADAMEEGRQWRREIEKRTALLNAFTPEDRQVRVR